jgi:hypothetical protein
MWFTRGRASPANALLSQRCRNIIRALYRGPDVRFRRPANPSRPDHRTVKSVSINLVVRGNVFLRYDFDMIDMINPIDLIDMTKMNARIYGAKKNERQAM